MKIEDAHVGRRIREVRTWRGKSLTATAELAGIATSYLSMIERGKRPVTKRATLEAIASALQVSPAELVGKPYAPTDQTANATHAAMTGVVDALTSWSIDETPGRPARPWQAVRSDVDRLNLVLRPSADYAGQAELLPSLVRDLISESTGTHRLDALIALVSAYKAAAYLAHDLGVAGLPALAAERMRQVAEEIDDPVWLSYVAYQRAQLLTGINRARQYDLAVKVADTRGARIETRGLAHLTAALSTASQGNSELAMDHLGEAVHLANRLEPETSPWMQTNFGRTNVGIWRVSIGVELGDGPKVDEVSPQIHLATVSASRQAAYWIDLGRGLLGDRRHRDRGLSALLQAERIAPQKVRNNVFVREAVTNLLASAQRDAGGRDLRGLAYRAGIAPNG